MAYLGFANLNGHPYKTVTVIFMLNVTLSKNCITIVSVCNSSPSAVGGASYTQSIIMRAIRYMGVVIPGRYLEFQRVVILR